MELLRPTRETDYNLSENDEVEITLTKSHFLKRIWLTLTGTVDVTLNGSSAGVTEEGVLGFIDAVTLDTAVGTLLNPLSGFELYQFNVEFFEQTPPTTDPGTSGGETEFKATLAVNPTVGVSNMVGLLNGGQYSPMVLNLRTGPITDMIEDTGDGSTTFSLVDCSLHVEQVMLENHNPGPNVVTPNVTKYVKQRTARTKNFSTGGTLEKINLTPGQIYTGLMIIARNDGSLSDGLVNDYKVSQEDLVTHRKGNVATLQAANKLLYEADFHTGVSYVDFDTARNLKQTVDTQGFDEWSLSLNVDSPTSSNGQLRIITDKLIRVKKAGE